MISTPIDFVIVLPLDKPGSYFSNSRNFMCRSEHSDLGKYLALIRLNIQYIGKLVIWIKKIQSEKSILSFPKDLAELDKKNPPELYFPAQPRIGAR